MDCAWVEEAEEDRRVNFFFDDDLFGALCVITGVFVTRIGDWFNSNEVSIVEVCCGSFSCALDVAVVSDMDFIVGCGFWK